MVRRRLLLQLLLTQALALKLALLMVLVLVLAWSLALAPALARVLGSLLSVRNWETSWAGGRAQTQGDGVSGSSTIHELIPDCRKKEASSQPTNSNDTQNHPHKVHRGTSSLFPTKATATTTTAVTTTTTHTRPERRCGARRFLADAAWASHMLRSLSVWGSKSIRQAMRRSLAASSQLPSI